MATVSELMPWSSQGTPLKAYLGVSGSSEDSNLTLWLGAMTARVDQYLDLDEADELTALPDPIKLAVYDAVGSLRLRHGRPSGLSYSMSGPFSESYKITDSIEAALRLMVYLLRPYKAGATVLLDG